MAADKIIEQIYADLKDSACAPAGVFTANAAWLLLAAIAFNPSQADQEPPVEHHWQRGQPTRHAHHPLKRPHAKPIRVKRENSLVTPSPARRAGIRPR